MENPQNLLRVQQIWPPIFCPHGYYRNNATCSHGHEKGCKRKPIAASISESNFIPVGPVCGNGINFANLRKILGPGGKFWDCDAKVSTGISVVEFQCYVQKTTIVFMATSVSQSRHHTRESSRCISTQQQFGFRRLCCMLGNGRNTVFARGIATTSCCLALQCKARTGNRQCLSCTGTGKEHAAHRATTKGELSIAAKATHVANSAAL